MTLTNGGSLLERFMFIEVEEEEDGGADATHEGPNNLKRGVKTPGDGEWNETTQVESPRPHTISNYETSSTEPSPIAKTAPVPWHTETMVEDSGDT